MNRFDKKGMMIYPNPQKKDNPCQSERVMVVEKCYCQHGHTLISNQVQFDGFPGILFKVERKGKNGRVALSPVYGCNHRVSLDLEFEDGQIWDFICPECGEALPYYTMCECGANMTTFFTTEKADYNSTIAVCNRVGCHNAEIFLGEKILMDAMLEAL